MSQPPLERIDLSLAEIRSLAASRRWQELSARLGEVPRELLLREPEAAFHLADALWRVGRGEEALEVARAVEAAAATSGNRGLLMHAVNVIGISLFELGRMPESEARFSELLEHATEWGDDEFSARASNNLGVHANVRGRREIALTYYQRALASYQRLGRLRGLAQTHFNLGISYRDLGFPGEADTHFGRAMELAEAAESEDVIARAEMERAALRAREGDGRLAERMARRALSRFEAMGDPAGAADTVRVLAAAARADGRDDEAATLLEEAFAAAESHPDPLLRAEIQRDRGLLLRDRGSASAARAALEDAAACFAAVGAEADAAALQALLDTL